VGSLTSETAREKCPSLFIIPVASLKTELLVGMPLTDLKPIPYLCGVRRQIFFFPLILINSQKLLACSPK